MMKHRTRKIIERRRRETKYIWEITPKGYRFLELLDSGISEEEAINILEVEFPEDDQ